MNLYLGYLLVQLCLFAVKLLQFNMSASAIFFTITVVVFWSFIPVVGYLLAKLFKANGHVGKYILFALGVVIAIIEKSLFYFEFLTKEQVVIGTFVAFILFFITAYISVNKTANKPIKRND